MCDDDLPESWSEEDKRLYNRHATKHCDAGDHKCNEVRSCPVCGFSTCVGHDAELQKHKALITKQHRHVSMEMVVAFCIIMQNGEGIVGKSPEYIQDKWRQYLRRSEFDTVRGILDSENQKNFEEWMDRWESHFEEGESIETE